MTISDQATSGDLAQKAAGGGTLVASTTAIVACAACCALPLLVPALALGASGAVLAWLAGAHTWLRVIAALAVLAAWGWAIRERVVRRRPIRIITLVLLAVSSVLTVIAFFWETIEPHLLEVLA